MQNKFTRPIFAPIITLKVTLNLLSNKFYMENLLEKTIEEAYQEVLEYVVEHKTRKRECELRAELSKILKDIKYQYGDHGDTKRLQKYIASTGLIISDSNFSRMFSSKTTEVGSVTERTYFMVLKHAVTFFPVADDHAKEILESILLLKNSKPN